MTMDQMTQWVKENFSEREAMETLCHFGDLRFIEGNGVRKPLGLADNVWLKNDEGPYDNCIVYAVGYPQYGGQFEMRILIAGKIYKTDRIVMGHVLKAAFRKELAKLEKERNECALTLS